MNKKLWLLAFALVASTRLWAADLVLGVSEGTSGGLDHEQALRKYQGLANVIGNALHRKVNIVFTREFALLEGGMKKHRYDFVMARPSDYPARGLTKYGFEYLATAKPEGQCFIITRKDSGIHKLADLKGRKLVLPEAAAYMTKFCRAELRDQGIDLARENVQYVREQGAVAFYIDNRFADAGAVASYSGVGKKWDQAGKVIYKSRPQPYFPLIASAEITAAQRADVQKALLALPQTDPGVLKTVGIEGFDVDTEKRLRALLDWLGPDPSSP